MGSAQARTTPHRKSFGKEEQHMGILKIAGKVAVGALAAFGAYTGGRKVYDHFSKDKSEDESVAAAA